VSDQQVSANFTVDLAAVATGYFTVAELRATENKLGDVDAFPDDDLDAMRQTVEEAFEHEEAANVAFVPRLRTETFSGSGTERLVVSAARVRSAVSATADGEPLDVTAARAVTKRGLWLPATWPAGDSNLVVTYEHGYDAPPLRVKRAALILAKGPIDDRATQVPDGAGGAINLATPGLFGARFGIPEVDAVIAQYRERPPAGVN
jgi:hypothetical protein